LRHVRYMWIVFTLLALCTTASSRRAEAAHVKRTLPTPVPAVITLSVIRADQAARYLRTLYPHARIVVDAQANTLIVQASADEINAMRQLAAGIDTKSPLTPLTQSFALHRSDARALAGRLKAIYPSARFEALGARTLLVSASSADLQQIQSVIAAIDAPPSTPAPLASTPPPDTEAVRIYQAAPRVVAREVAGAVHGLRVSVAGNGIILSGSPDLVQRAKDVIAVLDAPPAGTRYTAVYRIKTLDAKSVADLLARAFPDVKVSVDEEINALSVYATAAEQRRIAEGIAQLDAPVTTSSGTTVSGAPASGASGPAQVYTLKYALPGQSGGPSTSASDLAAMVTQTLGSQAPDLHITAAPSSTQLILTGNPYSIKLARDLLGVLDVPQQLVVLDTEILEMDENTAKNLGIQLQNAVGGPFAFGTIFSEMPPSPNPITGITPPLKSLMPLTRTALSFAAILNLAIEHGTARVLADPRITTLSGHTATIRAGDNISIQLQAGGGPGTIATTQIQTFQTGVTLDITPIVNDGNLITVQLHPVVNSLTGILNGIPQISTRDTQTTVALKENETLVIGGLIQEGLQELVWVGNRSKPPQ